jgi:hypothetical protein
MNGSSHEAKVNVTVMFLIGTTNIWWRNRVEDLESNHTIDKIDNW